MRAFRDATHRRIVDAANAAGFEPFGNDDSATLLFRSPLALLTVHWDRGYFRAECEPRTRRPQRAIDDDLFRQLVDHEAPDPDGTRREWLDHDAFVAFLRSRLGEFALVATSDDPDTKARLFELEKARAERAQAWWDSLKAPSHRKAP